MVLLLLLLLLLQEDRDPGLLKGAAGRAAVAIPARSTRTATSSRSIGPASGSK